jgi:hypothetical protein
VPASSPLTVEKPDQAEVVEQVGAGLVHALGQGLLTDVAGGRVRAEDSPGRPLRWR